MKHTYKVDGATCSSCGLKVKTSLAKISDVKEVIFNESTKEVAVEMVKHVALSVLQSQLEQDYGKKYNLVEVKISSISQNQTDLPEKSFKTYWPLILVVSYIFLGSILGMNLAGEWSLLLGMRLFMGLFFLAFGFFKLLDVSGFAMSYLSYDIVAQKVMKWGYVYPFVEFALGVAYLLNFAPKIINLVTLVLMLIGLVGVVRAVMSKREIRCACLGTGFNLPMSTVTIVEDAVMAIMAAVMLIL